LVLNWGVEMGVEGRKLLERVCWKWNCVLNDVEEREVEDIQHSWISHRGILGATHLVSLARALHAPTWCVPKQITHREKV
jgi:hypothetical protein